MHRSGLMQTDISEGWLDIMTLVIDRYLNWVEGYETKWDEERKRREDEQTNFGPLLQEMNQKINDLLVEVFGPKCKPPIADGNCDATTVKSARELRESDDKEDAVPNLKPYLDEMVLGYGRSPTSLGLYLKENVIQKLGPDAATRREARKTANSEDFAMFQRMKEYMKIVEETNSDGELYLNPLAHLVTEWHNILVDFQFKLTQHYVEYLAEHPLPNNDFKRLDIEVIDMENPENFDLLTDYDEFHKLYTVPGVPVVFGNVNMTNHQYTPEYLIEQCSAADVTDHIKVSNPVGKKSTDGWGGLDDYVLHDELLNDEREEDDDRSLTLEQFILLSEELDNIYLHDYSLPDQLRKDFVRRDSLWRPSKVSHPVNCCIIRFVSTRHTVWVFEFLAISFLRKERVQLQASRRFGSNGLFHVSRVGSKTLGRYQPFGTAVPIRKHPQTRSSR